MIVRLLPALLLGALAAQGTPCFSLNDANTTTAGTITTYGFSGENASAWQFTPTVSNSVLAARIFTGNTALSGNRYMTVEIWSDVAGTPGARLAGGTWKIAAALGNAWQGANLDLPAILTANTPYWLVFVEPGWSTVPHEPGGLTVPTVVRSNAGWTVLVSEAPKFRLYCSFLDDGNVAVVGGPCPSSAGRLGTAFTNQQPLVGNLGFAIEGTGFASNAPAVLVLGLVQGFPPTPVPGLPPGCLQHTDVGFSTFALTGTGTTRGPTAAGHVHYLVGIPGGNPGLAGLFVGAQLVSLDAGSAAPLPFVTSNGLGITIL
jgi:hypothetical protein